MQMNSRSSHPRIHGLGTRAQGPKASGPGNGPGPARDPGRARGRGAPAEGPPPPPPWGPGWGWAPAEEPGGDRLAWAHLKRLYKAPTDYTKPQKYYTRPHKYYTKT